jgi:carnitine-CoA ligase
MLVEETRALGFQPAEMRSLEPADRTIPIMLDRQAELHGERPLVRWDGRCRTVAGMRDAAARAGGLLLEAGVEPGERVVFMSANRLELLDFILGCGWIGAVAVLLNTAARGPQLEHVLRTSGARLLVVDGDLVPVIAGASLPPPVKQVWALDDPAATAVPGHVVLARAPELDGAPVAEAATVRPADTAVVLFTSGTTGPAKGVCLPHGQLHAFAVNACELLEITGADVLYTCLPLYHINALSTFFQALASGATYVLDGRFSASRFWTRVAAARATVTYLLPAMVGILLSRDVDLGERNHRLRVINGAVASERMQTTIQERFGVGVRECYASTELGIVLGVAPGTERAGWMGRPLAGYEVRVAGENDEELQRGTPGEMLVRPRLPDSMFSGYLGRDDATVEAWRNGWFHTGDRVVEGEDGRLRFVDRLSDSIRRRGENISAWEVEEVLRGHPAVAEVAAFAVPSDLGEDEVMVAVVPKPGRGVEPAELTAYAEPRLASYAIPRYVDVVAELPLTENGKVRKATLRDRGITTSTWDRGPRARPSAPR